MHGLNAIGGFVTGTGTTAAVPVSGPLAAGSVEYGQSIVISQYATVVTGSNIVAGTSVVLGAGVAAYAAVKEIRSTVIQNSPTLKIHMADFSFETPAYAGEVDEKIYPARDDVAKFMDNSLLSQGDGQFFEGSGGALTGLNALDPDPVGWAVQKGLQVVMNKLGEHMRDFTPSIIKMPSHPRSEYFNFLNQQEINRQNDLTQLSNDQWKKNLDTEKQ